jgi:DNA polymerase-3 subunit alpha
VAGAEKKGYGAALANKLFDLMAMFAEYGFNKSHTAAYAVVTYQTAWLKAHYPAEFLAATISSDMDDTDKVQVFVADAKLNKVAVLGPDINRSEYRFVPVDAEADPARDRPARAIRYGLGGIKGTGEAAVRAIVTVRDQGGPFKDLYDFCARVDRKAVNRRTIEAMVRAGAFDALDSDRAKLLANVGAAMEAAEAAEAAAGQASLFGGDAAGEDTASLAPLHWISASAWTERQRLQEEKSALGFFLSGHLFNGFASEVRRFVRTRLADLAPAPSPVWIAGIVVSLRTQMTRRGKMCVVLLDDGSAAVELPVYNELYERYRSLIREDELLVIQAKISKDDYSGGLRVMTDRILDLTAARQEFGKRVLIRLNGTADGALLKAALQDYAACTIASQQPDAAASRLLPVIVEYASAQARCQIELGASWRVQPREDMIEAVRQRLHPQAVAVEY